MNQPHRYSSLVSKLFITAAVVMLVTYPFFQSFLPQGPTFMIAAMAILSIMAGLTKPKGRWIPSIDIVISLFAVALFESHAIVFARTTLVWIFLTDQLLTLIFLSTLYLSARILKDSFRA